MSGYLPVYRATVYRPRSVDATESTPLTPIAGAPHADAFRVTSVLGLGGWMPYLDAIVGRRGKMDLLTRKVDTGELRMRLLDKRTTVGGTNLQRWVTAFMGDTQGWSALLGCKTFLEESLDGGATWAPFFTGRIDQVNLADVLNVELTLRDFAEDLQDECFVESPHASASYASPAPLSPWYLHRGFGGAGFGRPMWGEIRVMPSGARVLVPHPSFDKYCRTGRVVTKALFAAATSVHDGVPLRHFPAGFGTPPKATELRYEDSRTRVYVRRPDTGAEGEVYLRAMQVSSTAGGRISRLAMNYTIEPLPTTDASYIDVTAWGNGQPVEWRVFSSSRSSDSNPLLITDVHPVQLWADILDGKFGHRTGAGQPATVLPRDKSASGPWHALLSDPSFGRVRFFVTEPAKINEWIEKHICLPCGLAYRIDALGRVVPIDVRRRAGYPNLQTIGDQHLNLSAGQAWSQARGDAVARVEATYQVDEWKQDIDIKDEWPEVKRAGLTSTEAHVILLELGDRSLDLGRKSVTLNGAGFRVWPNEIDYEDEGGGPRAEAIRSRLLERAIDLQHFFAAGSLKVTLKVARGTAGGPTDVWPGEWRLVQVSTLPDPATNVRGGARLMLCTGRTEEGPSLSLEFLDGGPNSIAAVPTLGALAGGGAASLESGGYTASVPLTLNVAEDSAEIQYAITPTGAARPTEGDRRWRSAFGPLRYGGIYVRRHLPGSSWVWFRARSISDGSRTLRRLPSAWVFPSGAGYVATPAPPTPTGLAASGLTGGTVSPTWTLPGTADVLSTLVLLTEGAAPASWTKEHVVQTLPGHATRDTIRGLKLGTTYTVGVRHRDLWGGLSPVVSVSFTTPATRSTCPRPAGLDIASRQPT